MNLIVTKFKLTTFFKLLLRYALDNNNFNQGIQQEIDNSNDRQNDKNKINNKINDNLKLVFHKKLTFVNPSPVPSGVAK